MPGMGPSPTEQPRDAANEWTQGWRRIVGAYAVDLAVSLALVLIGARLWGVAAAAAPESAWAIDLHVAVGRFTPAGLWDIYRDEIRVALAALGHAGSAGFLPNVLLSLRLLLYLLLAAPATLVVIWQQTETLGDWVTLIGFGTILFGTFLVLVTGRWLSLTRLLIAAIGSPLIAVGSFWMVRQSLLDMVDGFGWLAAVAPWCLLCPVACTLYWAVFPNADHGATVACLRAARRLRVSVRRRRHRAIIGNVATIPLTRK